MQLLINSFAEPAVKTYTHIYKYKSIQYKEIIIFDEKDKKTGGFLNVLPLRKGQKYYTIITAKRPDVDGILNAIRRNAAIFDMAVYKGCILVGFEY